MAISGSPGLGMYTASKHAIRALADSLAGEVAPFGIKVLNIEPGYFRTALLKPGARSEYEARIPAYQPIIGPVNDMLQGTRATIERACKRLIRKPCSGKRPPAR